ncbi:MAG TPA: hypothetical protein VN317_01215 [Candidatus Methanoperedens sp.]|nr:hypothetical protein [Candidatus Methanoperedens sp.]
MVIAATLGAGCASSLPLARVQPVAIHARGDAAEIDAFAASVDAALAAIAGRLELALPARGLEIRLFGSRRSMNGFLREHCPEQSGKAAACFSRPGGFTVTVAKSAQPGETERALRHELTHYLLASHYRHLPRWIDEGLAQYLEVDPSRPRGDKRELFVGQRVPTTASALTELISRVPRGPLAREQYLLSWALASFLMEDDSQGRDRVKEYLSATAAADKALDRFEASFGSLAEQRPAWESFLSRMNLLAGATSRPAGRPATVCPPHPGSC